MSTPTHVLVNYDHDDVTEAILQQLRAAWTVERQLMLQAPKPKARDIYSHGCNMLLNAIGVVLSKGTITWAYFDGVAWLRAQGEKEPFQ